MLALGAALVLATLRASAAVAWPFAAHARAYVEAACGAVLALLTFTAVLSTSLGRRRFAAAVCAAVESARARERARGVRAARLVGVAGRQNAAFAAAAQLRPAVAGVAAWFLVTMVVARTVHHWAGVPYDVESLAESTTFHSSLAIVWGLAGLAAMIVGARALRRSVWLAGAALMAVVVAKLFIVDLGNTDTLARVVSFLGVGLLLLVVGYFAPVPPRAEARSSGRLGRLRRNA